jgi:regulatory protein
MRPRLSLKGRALQWLSQREHSRIELRRKLLRQARAEAQVAARESSAGSLCDPAADGSSESPGDGSDLESLALEVDALLDWLQAHKYLSDERFVESRVHARSARFGNLRIRQELQQHGLCLDPEASANLAQSERERAREVRQRKFGDSAATPSDRARQARFLAGRGFSAEVIWQVMREVSTG